MFSFDCLSSAFEYASTHQLYKRYVAEGLVIDSEDDNTETALSFALELDVHRQLTWTLCQIYPQGVEELSIPLNDIDRYIDHVHQFASLSKVIFTLEQTVYDSRPTCIHVTIYESRHRRQLGDERDRLFRDMVRFVRQHTSIHTDVLRRVEIPSPFFLPKTSQNSPVDVWFEILSFLPPPQNPRSIDHRNWCEIVARLSSADLSHVKSINLIYFKDPAYAAKTLTLLSNQPPFLPRCRALEKLEMETLGPDMFHWAVLEKKQKDEEKKQESIVGRHLSSWQCGHYNTLVPLQFGSIIHGTPLEPVQEVNDIAFAFSDSLEELTVSDKTDRRRVVSTDLAALPRVVHGKG
jgi:hypothetical protein